MCPTCYKKNYYNDNNNTWDETRYWWSDALCHKCGDKHVGPIGSDGAGTLYRRWLDGKEKKTSTNAFTDGRK